MKQIFKIFALTIAVALTFSCAKDPVKSDQAKDNVKVVHFSTTPVTKTVFGTPSGSSLPTLWTDTYCVAVSLNYATAKKSTTLEVGAGSTTANFSAEIADDDSGAYKFIAVSPYDSYVSASSSYTSVQFNVPTAQTPLAASPDEKAQILLGQYDAGSTFPTSVTMNFDHLTAYGKISFSNLALQEGETVASVSLTASENWAGRFYYYIEDHGDYNAGDIQANSASSTITITTDKTSDIWFGCAPVDLGGKTMDVVVTTNTGTTYSRTITIPTGKKFTAGVVNSFTINMNGIRPDGAVVYTLVDDVADLTLGSEVIIVADDANFALSTTQNTNNRGQASVNKSTSTGGDQIVSSPGVDVQVLTIGNGNAAGTYALSTGEGYLYAVSGSNHLKTESSLNNAGSWSISITNAGIATIKSIGTTDTRIMRYNSSSSIFSCYASGQKDIRIYKKNGTGSGAITAKVPESLAISDATTAYSVDDPYEFDGTVTLVYSDKSTEVLSSSAYTVDDSEVDMSAADTYTVTVVYKADNNITGSYDITVSGGAVTPTATFSDTDYTGQGTSGSGGSVSATKSVITVASDKGYGASEHVRVYSNGKITITSTGGNITKVEVTCTASGNANYGPSKLSATSGYSYSGYVGTWAGTAAKTVTLNATAQVRFTQIVVTYETE